MQKQELNLFKVPAVTLRYFQSLQCQTRFPNDSTKDHCLGACLVNEEHKSISDFYQADLKPLLTDVLTVLKNPLTPGPCSLYIVKLHPKKTHCALFSGAELSELERFFLTAPKKVTHVHIKHATASCEVQLLSRKISKPK